MNIGIIVYSQTGNTRSVAQKLQEKLQAGGHTAAVEQVTATGETAPGSKNFQLTAIPETGHYDALVFGAPVQAFSLNPVMGAYLKQLPPLDGKKVACYVTKQLPFRWTGGNRSVTAMKNICTSKGAIVCGTGIVIWSKSRREQNAMDCVESLSRLF